MLLIERAPMHVDKRQVEILEWGKHTICVNALAPTFVETPMTRPMLSEKSHILHIDGGRTAP